MKIPTYIIMHTKTKPTNIPDRSIHPDRKWSNLFPDGHPLKPHAEIVAQDLIKAGIDPPLPIVEVRPILKALKPQQSRVACKAGYPAEMTLVYNGKKAFKINDDAGGGGAHAQPLDPSSAAECEKFLAELPLRDNHHDAYMGAMFGLGYRPEPCNTGSLFAWDANMVLDYFVNLKELKQQVNRKRAYKMVMIRDDKFGVWEWKKPLSDAQVKMLKVQHKGLCWTVDEIIPTSPMFFHPGPHKFTFTAPMGARWPGDKGNQVELLKPVEMRCGGKIVTAPAGAKARVSMLPPDIKESEMVGIKWHAQPTTGDYSVDREHCFSGAALYTDLKHAE